MKEKDKIVELEEKELNFSDEPTVFGRSEDCDVCIEDPSISQRHCAIRLWEETLIVMDMGSTNGTKVNGQKINKVCALKPGDKVHIGNIILEI